MDSLRKIFIFLFTWLIASISLTFLILAIIQLWDFQMNLGELRDFRYYITDFFWLAFGVSMLISLLIAYLLFRYFEKKMLSTKKIVVFLIAWPLIAILVDIILLLIGFGIVFAISINTGASVHPDLWLIVDNYFWQLFGVCFLLTPILIYAIADLMDSI